MIISFLQRNVSLLSENNQSAKEAFGQAAVLSRSNRFHAAGAAISGFGHLIKQASTNPPFWLRHVIHCRFKEGAKKLGNEFCALLQKMKIIALAVLMIVLGLLFPQTLFGPLSLSKTEKKPHKPEDTANKEIIPLNPTNKPNPWVRAEFVIGNETQVILFNLEDEQLLSTIRRLNPEIAHPLLSLITSAHANLRNHLSPINVRMHMSALPKSLQSILAATIAAPPRSTSADRLLALTLIPKEEIPAASLQIAPHSISRPRRVRPHTPRFPMVNIPRPLSTRMSPLQLPFPSTGPLSKPSSSPKEEAVELDFEMVPNSTDHFDRFFQDYVVKYCPNYQMEDVKMLIDRGRELVNSIQSGVANNIPLDQRRQWMAPFVWTLMFHYFKKGDAYHQGMSRFLDPDHKIANFFIPVASKRPCSHYKGQRLGSYGIDIEQNYRAGLPGSHQTVLFGPLKAKKNQPLQTYLKPENWGMESLPQILGHTVDYLFTRVWNPVRPNDRKEHIPKEIVKKFEVIYQTLTNENTLPPDVHVYGISEMARFFIHYLEKNPQDEKIELIRPLLEELESLNSSLSLLTVTGKEAWAGTSFLDNESSKPSPETLAYRKFRAIFQLKTAKDPQDIADALNVLKEFKEEWIPCSRLAEETLAAGFLDRGNGSIKKGELLDQVRKDIGRSKGPELFLVDSVSFQGEKGRTEHDLLKIVLSSPSIQNNEEKALIALALMQQGVKASIWSEIRRTMFCPIPGLEVKGYSQKNQQVAEVKITTTPHLKIEIWQKYSLIARDIEKKHIFRDNPYAIFMGFIEIDYATGTPKAKIKWKIDQVLK